MSSSGSSFEEEEEYDDDSDDVYVPPPPLEVGEVVPPCFRRAVACAPEYSPLGDQFVPIPSQPGKYLCQLMGTILDVESGRLLHRVMEEHYRYGRFYNSTFITDHLFVCGFHGGLVARDIRPERAGKWPRIVAQDVNTTQEVHGIAVTPDRRRLAVACRLHPTDYGSERIRLFTLDVVHVGGAGDEEAVEVHLSRPVEIDVAGRAYIISFLPDASRMIVEVYGGTSVWAGENFTQKVTECKNSTPLAIAPSARACAFAVHWPHHRIHLFESVDDIGGTPVATLDYSAHINPDGNCFKIRFVNEQLFVGYCANYRDAGPRDFVHLAFFSVVLQRVVCAATYRARDVWPVHASKCIWVTPDPRLKHGQSCQVSDINSESVMDRIEGLPALFEIVNQ